MTKHLIGITLILVSLTILFELFIGILTNHCWPIAEIRDNLRREGEPRKTCLYIRQARTVNTAQYSEIFCWNYR
jgi:hypothetical protein